MMALAFPVSALRALHFPGGAAGRAVKTRQTSARLRTVAPRVQIRSLRRGDIDDVCSLFQAQLDEAARLLDSATRDVLRVYVRDVWTRQLGGSGKDDLALVLTTGGHVRGFAHAVPAAEGKHAFRVTALGVHPALRGKGHEALLLREVEDFVRRSGGRSLSAFVPRLFRGPNDTACSADQEALWRSAAYKADAGGAWAVFGTPRDGTILRGIRFTKALRK